MEKHRIDRRIEQMGGEGVEFRTGVHVGVNQPAQELLDEFDAICLCGGACQPRNLPIPGRELKGIHFAMDYLPNQNREVAGLPPIGDAFRHAKDLDVVIIGGGDTGADCLGTVHRHGCRSVHQFEIVPRPPDQRLPNNPWPQWWNTFKVASAHEEGGVREYSISTTRFLGDDSGHVRALETMQVEGKLVDGRFQFVPVAGTEKVYKADLVLLAMGFTGSERAGMLEQLGVAIDRMGNVATDGERQTSVPKVFAAGDMARGQSLIVWAIAEGRHAAHAIDRYLMGESALPRPLDHGNLHRPFA
jgi:glutamate synthase (NADPH/NADH) small chain